uniref:Uncharacterized protein n=1 Tax=Anopheles culicifacies TaxID=139723 RepID=A0A182ME98_9DIPT
MLVDWFRGLWKRNKIVRKMCRPQTSDCITVRCVSLARYQCKTLVVDDRRIISDPANGSTHCVGKATVSSNRYTRLHLFDDERPGAYTPRCSIAHSHELATSPYCQPGVQCSSRLVYDGEKAKLWPTHCQSKVRLRLCRCTRYRYQQRGVSIRIAPYRWKRLVLRTVRVSKDNDT